MLVYGDAKRVEDPREKMARIRSCLERLETTEPDIPPLVARLAGARPPLKGDRIHIEIDPDRLHLFRESGAAID